MKKKDQACKLKPDRQFFFFVQLYLSWLRNLSDRDQRIVRFIFDLDEKERGAFQAALVIFEDYKKGKFNEKISSDSYDRNLCVNGPECRCVRRKKAEQVPMPKRKRDKSNIQDNPGGQTPRRQRKSKKGL